MNKKTKIISLLTSFCLVVALFVVGVLAARQATVPMGGNINFTAVGINAKVEKGDITGGTINSSAMDTLIYSTYKDVSEQKDTSSWENLSIDMTEGQNTVSLGIKVTNTSKVSTDKIWVVFSINSAETNLTYISIVLPETGSEILPGEENARTFIIKFVLDDSAEYDGSETFSINVTLANEIKSAEETGLSFDLPQNGTSAVITGYNDKMPADLVIPGQVRSGDEIYTISKINDNAFKGCTTLTSITIPSTVSEIGSEAFRGCSSLGSITLGEGLKTIGGSALHGTAIKSLAIPEGVETLGKWMANACRSLTSLTISSTVIKLEEAFVNCSVLETIFVSEDNEVYTSRDLSGKEVNAVIKKETHTLATGGARTAIPSDGSVTVIGNSAFYGNKSLKSITIPYGVTLIDDAAFYACENLAGLTIPSTVERVGGSAFLNCKSFTSLDIPAGIVLSDHAFQGCTGLKSVVIPKNVTMQSDWTFNNATGLESVVISEGVKIEATNAFNGTTSLKTVTIEDTDIYKAVTASSHGKLLAYAETVKVLKTIVDDASNSNSYLRGSTFTRTIEGNYYVFNK